MRYFLNISYDGTNYHGWQRQGNSDLRTVQLVLEDLLRKYFKNEVTVYGCGRTDAGVHASQYILHINVEEEIPFDMKFRLNKNLPDTISVMEVRRTTDAVHSRYSAVERTYEYFIHWKKDAILARYSSYYEYERFDFRQMQKATSLIRNLKDFRALCRQPDLYKNTLCTITKCEITINQEQGRMRFIITSNRFLRGMVRYCVFFLIEIGKGKLSIEDFEKVLKEESVYDYKKPAYPEGLFLSKITYQSIKFEDESRIIKLLRNGFDH